MDKGTVFGYQKKNVFSPLVYFSTYISHSDLDYRQCLKQMYNKIFPSYGPRIKKK